MSGEPRPPVASPAGAAAPLVGEDVGRLPVRRLRPGDRVALVSPCSPPYPDRLAAGITMLRSWGLEVDPPPAPVEAGRTRPAQERADELQRALEDPGCSAVLVTRAGAGAADVLPLVDLSVLDEQPKPFCGFSDVTVLHNDLTDRCRRPSFHVPELAWSSRLNGDDSARSLQELLMGDGPGMLAADAGVTRSWGPAVGGRLRGGNLSTLVRTEPPRWRGGDILFLEELRETPSAVEALLRRLSGSGHADDLAGVLLGQFVDCGNPAELQAVLESWCSTVSGSVLSGAPVGHGHDQRSLPLAWDVEVDPGRARVTWCASPTSSDTGWR